MSCSKCASAQSGVPNRGAAYYRWKNANIEVIACDEHLKQVFEALNSHQTWVAGVNGEKREKPHG